MQDYGNGKLVFSASDLTGATECSWAAVRKIDKKLGFEIEIPSDAEDGMLARTGELGNVHEEKQLQKYRDTFGDQVVELGRPDYKSSVPLEQQMVELTKLTKEALESQKPVVFQGTFFDGAFQGFADFLVIQDDGSYAVYDTKLARKAKITALVQIAAYADQLNKMGIPVSRQAHLILGDNSLSSHNLEDIMPLYLKKRQDMIDLIATRIENKAKGGVEIQWDDETYQPCGRCIICEPEIERTDDVISVAGLRMEQRAKLRADGIVTLKDLATTNLGKITDMSARTFASLKAQARVQLTTRTSENKSHPHFEVFDAQALSVIPAPDEGDIFFDFEGDPLYSEGSVWGIDYLFGWVDQDNKFFPLWAHNLEQEKVAFLDFVNYIKERRALHPKMHIYHYAAYEKTHLLSLAARYGVEEDFISQLLRENVLVDLYPIVRRAVLIGSYSYSLKKLEPIFVTDEERAGVTNAADSVVEYANYCEMVANNELEKAELKLKQIEDYNAYDCRSTLGLRNWLKSLAEEHGVQLRGVKHATEREEEEVEQDPLYENLMSLISDTALGDRTNDHTAIALTAAAIDFHRREKKSFWWEHFSRLENPMDEWENDKDVYVVEKCEIVSDWALPASARAKLKRRMIKLHTKPGPGSKVNIGDARWLLYPADATSIPGDENAGFLRVVTRSVVTAVEGDSVLFVEESLPADIGPYDYVPLAVVPGQPIDTRNLEAAIKQWGAKVFSEYPNLNADPALDILRRRSPTGTGLEKLDVNASYETITKAIRNIENSFLAIQGPPGAGKSFNGGKVIGDLVMNHGWKVGVVGQSHSTVENLLKSIHKNGGVPANLIAKPGSKSHEEGEDTALPWVVIDKGSKKTREYRDFIEGKSAFVIGGTAWDLAHRERVGLKELDLLVIDEAGQFSLANTIAVSSAAKRLLLLGDPQQLPQVTQGMHPEPVDGSALGWLAGNDEVLSKDFGYFLPSTYRMSSQLCSVVSSNWYESRLGSVAPTRGLEGVEPGFYPVPIKHFGSSTESIEEADKVVQIVNELQNKNWNDGESSGKLIDAHENIIVVAPYNAQVQLIRKKLDAAGLTAIPVGTVDKFQGQEAAVAIISMTASSANEIPRGIEFLLMPNRLNVAISRAKWAAYLVYSPKLLDYKPTNVENLRLISKFINLVWKAK
jgi:predicted RecB family nuclease